jgi:hypothetical protein
MSMVQLRNAVTETEKLRSVEQCSLVMHFDVLQRELLKCPITVRRACTYFDLEKQAIDLQREIKTSRDLKL